MSWRKVKLKDVLKQYRIEHIVQDTIEYKQVSILNSGNVVVRGAKLGKEIGRKRQFIIDVKKYPNTLIFTRQLLLQGSIGIANNEVDQCIVTENMPMFSVNTDLINVDFLILFLKSEVFKSQIRKIELSGSAQKSIHEKTFLELEFLLPKLEAQNEIANVISAFNEKNVNISTELKKQQDYIKQLRQAFLREAMQGLLVKTETNGETGAELLEKIKTEKAQLIKEKKLKKEKELPPISDEEIPFEIPENWTWCRLGEVGELNRGKSKHRPRNDSRLFEKGTFPFIQTGGVARSKNTNYLIDTINGYYNEFGLKQSELQKKGTLCITIAANIAECGFLNFDACLPDSIVCFKSLFQIIEKFVFYFIIDAQKEIEKYAPATAQKNINLEILKALAIPFPPLHEQNQIVTKLEELMAFCDGLEESIKASQGVNEKLLQEVLREALQGEGVNA